MYTKKYKQILLFIFSIMANYNLKSMDLTNLNPGQMVQANILQQNTESEDGYWALYNGIITSQILENKSIADLLSQSKLQECFYHLSVLWKNYVIQNRIETLAKYYIMDILFQKAIIGISVLPGQLDSNIEGYQLNLSKQYIRLADNFDNLLFSKEDQRAICDLIKDIAENLVNKSNFKLNTNHIYQFHYDHVDILNAFKEEIRKKAEEENNDLYRGIYKNFTDNKFKYQINCCDTIFHIDFEILGDNKILDIFRKEHAINWQNNKPQDPKNSSFRPGEQLSDVEMNFLINTISEAKEDYNNWYCNSPIFCLNNNIKEQFELNSNLKKLVQNLKNNSYQGNAIFIFKYNNRWASCVIDKKNK